jgi:hypothetical protein
VDFEKLWNDQVGSKVIAGVILAALLGAVGWVMHLENWWPVVGHGITVTWAYLQGTTPVRRWVFGALVFIAGLFVFLVISVGATLYHPKENPFGNVSPIVGPDWLSYTTDDFYELKWRWRYRDGEIKDLVTFCPRCDYQMLAIGTSRSSQVVFHCDICGKEYYIRESWDTLRSVVPRRIQQKIRTESYPKT